jgi:hypothetical protein
MRCFDCGKDGKLFEYTDGRRVVHLCPMCKAEREWRDKPNDALIPAPPVKENLWLKLKRFLGLK